MTCLFDIFTNNLLEITNGNQKVKETNYIEKSRISSQIDDFTSSGTKKIFIPEKPLYKSRNSYSYTR